MARDAERARARPARRVLHLDVDAFLASVEQALHPELAGKPVIVGGMPDGRNLVMSCSYEARAFGVRAGMLAAEAARRCPRAVFRHGDSQAANRMRERVARILLRFTPKVEVASIDDFFADLTGTERLCGPAFAVAERARAAIRAELSLPVTIGIGANKTVARIAGKLAKPGGVAEIWPGCERRLLGALPVEHLPGVGHAIGGLLERFAIRTVGELALVSREILFASFGTSGLVLHERARGIDEAPVEPTYTWDPAAAAGAADNDAAADGDAAAVAAGAGARAEDEEARLDEAEAATRSPARIGASDRPDAAASSDVAADAEAGTSSDMASDVGASPDAAAAPDAPVHDGWVARAPRSIRRDSTFEPEEGRRAIVEAMLGYMVERAAHRLRLHRAGCRALAVRVVYVDTRPGVDARAQDEGGMLERRRALEAPSDATDELWRHAREILRELPRRRALVKRVGVTLCEVAPLEGWQGRLFSEPGKDRGADETGAPGSRADRQRRIDRALDRLRGRHGFGRILRGTSFALAADFPLEADGFRLRTPSLNQ